MATSKPILNLPAGETYDPHKEYADHLTYYTVTVAVDIWLMTGGTISGDEVTITVRGGCVTERLTADEIATYTHEDGVVEPGAEIATARPYSAVLTLTKATEWPSS